MKDLRESLLVKVTAIFLAALLFIGAALFLAGTVVYYETGLGRAADFFSTEICANVTDSAIYAVYDNYQGYNYRLYNSFGVNFGYEIYGPLTAAGDQEDGSAPGSGETQPSGNPKEDLSSGEETSPDRKSTRLNSSH